jgi:hypothetical protein
MGETRCAYQILMGEALGNDNLDDRKIWESSTHMNRMEADCEDGWRSLQNNAK